MKSLNNVLKERAETHGDFEEGAEVYLQLAKLSSVNSSLDATQIYGMTGIMMKLTRISVGNPNEIDHWRDIAGYATLVADAMEKKANGN